MAEYKPAERTRQKSDGKRREHRNRRRELVELRKEQLIEHQRRDQAVDEEVVPFDRGADGAGDQDTPAAARRLLGSGAGGGMVVVVLQCSCRHGFLLRCHLSFCCLVVIGRRSRWSDATARVDQLASRAPSLALCPSARARTRPIVPACDALPRQATIWSGRIKATSAS
jgi:hypothetical protein